MIKKILSTLTSKPQTLAERIASEGISSTIGHPWRNFHGLVEGDTLHCCVDQPPPVPGQTFSTVDCLHPFIVVSVSPSPEEGIVTAQIQPMPFSVSIHKAVAAGRTMDGKDRYRLSPTSWRDVPAQVDGLTHSGAEGPIFRLPAPYVPDRGELIFHSETYYQIIRTDIQGPFCVCTTQEFPV